MSLFGQTKRHTPTYVKGRRSPLPVFAGADEKRFHPATMSGSSSGSVWYSTFHLPLPSISGSSSSDHLLNVGGPSVSSSARGHSNSRRRYVKVCLPVPPRLVSRISRMGRPLKLILLSFVGLTVLLIVLGMKGRRSGGGGWSGQDFWDSDSRVLTDEETAAIWEWEVISGHHPSLRQPPERLPITPSFQNPVVPRNLLPPIDDEPSPLAAYKHRTAASASGKLVGTGPDRHFVSPWDSAESQAGYPARPTPGTVLDLDLVLEKCDFGTNQYVRDCLEFLRIGGGLDNGRRVRRGSYLNQYKQLYYEADFTPVSQSWTPRLPLERPSGLSRTPLFLPPHTPVPGTFSPTSPCDPEYPRIFHMFWAGPFTDKPYMAVMSFLFTQNLGLDSQVGSSSETVRRSCRPQFWVWINPGPAAAVPNPSAKMEMYESLATNPWSAPFLHERFRDVVKFRMWNTTEQLDGVHELRDHWRQMPIFNSGGNTYAAPPPPAPAQTTAAAAGEAAPMADDEPKLGDVLAAEADAAEEAAAAAAAAPDNNNDDSSQKDDVFNKVGSKSESDYDRLSVILSDMARFVLTHRYGGIYLDADSIFLRDWEELWNYRGQFAYRWSWHDKYNTAVLKLHKGSALGTFLFKTALENGLDFHPMTVSKYLMDAGLDPLLFRIPDALFDPAWINMERYQRERPPFPYFPEFSAFFSNDQFDTAGPQPLGFDGFFRGAFSYHFHNFWWLPFDKSRNFPDLGDRFIKGEKALRTAQREAKEAEAAIASREGGGGGAPATPVEGTTPVSEDMEDEVDLSWSAVLKRTFEAYVRQERPNMYGEWMSWERA